MRARAGDPPRTMTQKILAGRADDPQLSADLPRVKVDQVILARDPDRAEVTLRRHFAIGDEYRRRAVTGEGDRPDMRNAQGA